MISIVTSCGLSCVPIIMEVSRKYQYGRTLELRNCLDVSFVTEEPEVKKLVDVTKECVE